MEGLQKMATITETGIRSLEKRARFHLARANSKLNFLLRVRSVWSDGYILTLKKLVAADIDMARFYRKRADDARELEFDKSWKRQPIPDEIPNMFAGMSAQSY